VGTGAASAASSRVVPDAVPTVSISTPGNGATGSAPAAFSLSATASAGLSGETISSVQYFANGTAIGPALTASPYTYSWSEVDAGTYSLTAAATDNYGRVGVSAAVSVTVQAAAGSAQIYYIYADQIDTPRLIVRPSDNQVRWRWDGADPFGASQPNANPAGLGPFVYNARFPGQLYDPETGTHYNYFRNYDPAIARYVQSDPIGLDGGINTYVYAGSAPVDFEDPNGLQAGASVLCGPFLPECLGAITAGTIIWMSGRPDAPGTDSPSSSGSDHCCVEYKNVYSGSPKHGPWSRPGPRGTISEEPTNGQAALDTSVPTGNSRLGFDPQTGELIIFRLTTVDEANCIKYWHGYVVTQKDLTPDQWRSGRNAGFPDWPRKPQ
jgi:RHS repeat-associated protein